MYFYGDIMSSITRRMTLSSIAQELGRRLASLRLQADVTQQALADEMGVSRSTVVKLEHGQGKIENLAAALVALDRTDLLDQFIPEPTISPMELLDLKGKQRLRGTRRTLKNEDQGVDW